mmetsp:Transcript_118002/g.341120  ORF Transcript_118002/g.341120 Transcript_118002/m.341120 type:complete len:244 (-) Transcript_118002:770-1501(-)
MAGLFRIAIQLRRIKIRLLILQCMDGLIADLEQVWLVRQTISGRYQAHLFPHLLLLLPLHRLLGLPLLFAATLLDLLGELLLELLVCLLLGGTIVALLFGSLRSVVVQQARNSLVDIVRSIAGALRLRARRLLCSLLLGLPCCSLGLLALPHDLRPPLHQRRQVLLAQHLQVRAQLADVVGGGRVLVDAFATFGVEDNPVVRHQDFGRVGGIEEVLDRDVPPQVPGIVASSMPLALMLQVLGQ